MPKIKVKANKLTEVDVDFVSLVKTPANKIPFRVVKSVTKGKNTMFNLDILGRKTEKSDDTATAKLLGVIVNKGAKTDWLEKAGVPLDHAEEMDAGTLYKFSEDDLPEKGSAIAVSKNVTLITEPVSKMFSPWQMENAALEKQVKAANIGSVFWTALDVASERAHEVLGKSDNPEEAAMGVKSVLEELSVFLEKAVKELPPEAFYIAKYANIADEELNGDDAEKGVDDDSADDGDDADDDSGENSGEDSGDETTGTDDSSSSEESGDAGDGESKDTSSSKDEPETKPKTKPKTKKSDDGEGDTSDVASLLVKLNDKIDGISATVEGLTKSVDKVTSDTSKLEEGLEALSKSVVIDDDDPEEVEEVEKSTDLWAGTALDKIV